MRYFESQKCEWCEEIKTCVKAIGIDQELAKKKIYEDKLIMVCPQCIHETLEEDTDPEFRREKFHLV